jgi:hypothetical protein
VTRGRILRAVAVSGLLLVGLGSLSTFPYGRDPEDAVLRLSWRVRGERVEECRRLSPEEVAALPVHMRRQEVCEGRVAPYHLTVRLDDRLLEESTIRPAGARADRPVYVHREYRLPPGQHRVDLEFRLEDAAAGVAAAEPFVFSGLLHLQAGEVVLVTLAPGADRLTVQGAAHRDGGVRR